MNQSAVKTRQMTVRERWLSALDMKPVDRLPFWPKIYEGYLHAHARGEFAGWTLRQFHAYIGSDQCVIIPGCVRQTAAEGFAFQSIQEGGRMRHIYHHPAGDMVGDFVWDEHSQSWHPLAFPVTDRRTLLHMAQWHRRQQFTFDAQLKAQADAVRESYGEDAVFPTTLPQSGLMHTVEFLAGIEGAQFLLMDEPDACDELFAARHAMIMAYLQLVCEHMEFDFLWPAENTSTTLISPQQYARFNAPYIEATCAFARRAGRRVVLHMCGHLKLLLDQLAKNAAHGFEAFTAPTLGSATLADGRAACPDKCLVGGTHAMIWLEPQEQIARFIEHHLQALPHHRGIVITSSGVMPPACSPQTIRAVCRWVHQFAHRD